VDVYHELAYPFEVMTKIREALKPGGRVVFVEYRKEDPECPLNWCTRCPWSRSKREMKTVGLAHLQTLETLPLQHILVSKTPMTPSRENKFGLLTLRKNSDRHIDVAVEHQRMSHSLNVRCHRASVARVYPSLEDN